MKRKLLAIVFAFLLLFGSIMTTQAQEPVSVLDTYVDGVETVSQDEMQMELTFQRDGIETYADYSASSIADAGAYMRKQMAARNPEISIAIRSTSSDYRALAKAISDKALEHTGVANEGDYLAFSGSGYDGKASYSRSGSYYDYVFTYNMQYYTNAAQEQVVIQKVAEILDSLALTNKSDYEKIRAIYDYVTDNVTYDYTNLDDTNYKLKYTAYAALVNKTAVCQGYSNLLYYMLNQAGIDCRIVYGIGNEEAHSWNLIALDGKYYYADPTWDSQTSYEQWFLRGSTDFPNHQPISDFISSYSIATTKYLAPTKDPNQPFWDVSFGDFYYYPVVWAYKNDITKGVSDTLFGPNESCTRGQVVTFLWRAEKKPIPEWGISPFVDVAANGPDVFYYDPVMWAVQKGITTGLTPTTFGPDETVTRAQFVTFLWRAAGKPEPTSASNTFTDIDPTEYYYKAILWAVEDGVTNGVGNGKFAPDEDCTRGQVVTFLYRAY